MNSYRDTLGRFKKGHSKEQIPVEEKLKAMYALQESWKKRKDYIGDLLKENPRIYNSWRAFMFTQKGKKIGHSDEWNDFRVFYNDVAPTYKKGLVFRRIDVSKPYSKDNFIWINPSEESLLHDKLVTLTFEGETLPLNMWATKYNISKAAIKCRYYKHKDTYTVEEIIFGKKKNRGSKLVKDKTEVEKVRAKVSKMLSSYRHKDNINGTSVCDYTIDELLEVIAKPCVYCGHTSRIGLDRIDNSKGHTKDNTVPCCYECNCARNNNFSFEEMKIIGKAIKQVKDTRLNNIN